MEAMKPRARSNLLISAVNAALERGLITLQCEPFDEATFQYELAGLPVIAHGCDIGFDEVSIHATCCPTDEGCRFVACAILSGHGRELLGEAIANGCLERRTGKYLQSSIAYYGSRRVTPILAAEVAEPAGFGRKPTKQGYDFRREFESVFGRRRLKI